MGLGAKLWQNLLYGFSLPDVPADPLPVPTDPMSAAVAAAVEQRMSPYVGTRSMAIQHSVVNRARDLICGTLSTLPLVRWRTRGGVDEELGPGWLSRPDPSHTRGWFVAQMTDDLFFNGLALARITARDDTDHPLALEHMPVVDVTPNPDDPGGVLWNRWPSADWGGGSIWQTAWGASGAVEMLEVSRRDLVVFESPVTGILRAGAAVMSTAMRLDGAADRFAGVEMPAGYLKQTGGEPLSPEQAVTHVTSFAQARTINSIAYLNEVLEYHESTLDPSRLQLVEGRSYQDAAVARVCNVPNYAVGVAVPGDSMTYKTAVTARLDLVDFGLAPFLECWTQTLSGDQVMPRGTEVRWDLEPFLRTKALAVMPDDQTNPAPVAAGSEAR